MMTTKHSRSLACAAALVAVAAIALSCGGTGGGGNGGNPGDQFFLNSSNTGRFVLNVNPTEVDANKSDRIGLVATLTDSFGIPVRGAVITFSSDIDDIRFLPGQTVAGRQVGQALTDANGNADIIAVAGVTPTGTGAIVGTGAIIAEPPAAFGLRAQVQVTLLDVGFIDAGVLAVIPSSEDIVEPFPGMPIFFNIVGGTPPYLLKNEVSGIGTATISQHCTLGCTENGGVLCVGSPCLTDGDCGVGSPAGTCIGPVKRCLASCSGTNCGGSRCDTDADCNDGSATPANVCKDSGQSIVYIIGSADVAGTHGFVVEDSAGGSITVTVNVSFVCGTGVASGGEQCDGGDFRGTTCASLGFAAGTILCADDCTFDTSNCVAVATPTAPAPTLTVTPLETPTLSPTPTPTVTPAATPTPGAAANLALSLLANCAGLNADTTRTIVIAAVVTDINSNPVSDGTAVLFSITAPNVGASIESPSQTNTDAPCNVTNFVTQCEIPVANQHGLAHTCITYPSGQDGTSRTVNGTSGAASDSKSILLPAAPGNTPTPTPTPTPP